MALAEADFRREQPFAADAAAVGEEPLRQAFEPNALLTMEDLESEDEHLYVRRPRRSNCALQKEIQNSVKQLRLEQPGLFAQQEEEEEPSEPDTTGLQPLKRTSEYYDSEATASTGATRPSAFIEIHPQKADMSVRSLALGG